MDSVEAIAQNTIVYNATINLSEIENYNESQCDTLIDTRLAGVTPFGRHYAWGNNTNFSMSVTGGNQSIFTTTFATSEFTDIFSFNNTTHRVFAPNSTSITMNVTGLYNRVTINGESKTVTVLGDEITFTSNSTVQTNDIVLDYVPDVTSNSLELTESIVGGIRKLQIEVPSSFQGLDYYVNSNYTGTEQLGTASKPFKTLVACIDKILNRGAFQDPNVNGGVAYTKWQVRPGVNEGAIRVIIQSYCETTENLAINRVEYFLERGGFESHIQVLAGTNLPYIIDMKELVDNAPKTAGKLNYHLTCGIGGSGTVTFAFGEILTSFPSLAKCSISY